jgi:rhodanese-related sulfurtransferase
MNPPLPPITAVELSRLLEGATPPRLIDVREPHEWISELGHIAGAELMSLGSVPQRLGELAGESREIISICKSGMRAGQAADFWAKNGLKVRVLKGGMLAWSEAKLPITRDR